MAVELEKETRATAIQSLERYFETAFDEKIGNMRAADLLGFFLEEIGPSIYNKAVADVQKRMLARVSEIDLECNEEEFAYWPRKSLRAKK
ncbi:MAG: hypothetical protein JWL63_623 [Rhodocyclales bacterium]|nr:hypothetical protein [Rhodocyclales bacterium]